MRTVLALATVLGVMGVIASFGLFYLGERVFHLNRDIIQTFMYLKLSVAGHLTIFVTRHARARSGRSGQHGCSSAPFWNAVAGHAHRRLRRLHDAHRLEMVLLVWGYALAWFLINDRVKLLAYRVFDLKQPSLLAFVRGGIR